MNILTRFCRLTPAPLAAGLLISLSLPAAGNRFVIIQEWEHTNFALNGLTLRTGAAIDVSPYEGAGIERFFVDSMSVTNYLNGIGQWSLLAEFPDPPSIADDRSIYAQYREGAFEALNNVDVGGASRTTLVNEFGTRSGLSVTAGDSQMIVHTSSGLQRYVQTSIEFRAVPSLHSPDLRLTSIQFVAGGALEIEFEDYDEAGVYALERSPDLAQLFTVVGNSSLQSAGGIGTYTDPTPPAGEAYYRVRRLE